jgi:tetratricopeptide (TPR) repeat protein
MSRRPSGDGRLRRDQSRRDHPARPRADSAKSGASAPRRLLAIRILRFAAGVIAICALYAGTVQLKRRVAVARLPALPELSSQTTAVSEHLRARFSAAQQDPTSDQTVGALCLAYHADMFYEHAERCYARAVVLNQREWRWTYYRGLIQSERGDADAVASAMRRVTDSVGFGPALWRLGEAEFKEGHYEQAEQAWRRAVASLEPERLPAESPPHTASVPLSAYASVGLARIALARGHADQARQILQDVSVGAPRFRSAFRLLAESYTLLGRPADADRAVHRANRLPPYAPYADPMVDALARESRNGTFLLRQASDADLADSAEWSEYLTRRALEFDPANPDVLSKLGRILRTLGRNEEALHFFLRYQEIVPGDVQAMAQIGSCLTALGEFREAESYLRRALGGLDDALTHYNLGLLLAQTGRLKEAVAEYGLALSLDPQDPNTHNNLAAVLVRQGRLAEASRELVRAIEIEPENANTHTNLGIVLAQQGQRERAAREFEAALHINPEHAEASEALRVLTR